MGSSTSSSSLRNRYSPRGASSPQTAPPAEQHPQPEEDAAAADLAARLDAWKILTHARQNHAQRLAIVDCFNPSASVPEALANICSYGQLYDHVLALAGHLDACGVSRGSRVAVMLRNCAEVGKCTQDCCGPCGLTHMWQIQPLITTLSACLSTATRLPCK